MTYKSDTTNTINQIYNFVFLFRSRNDHLLDRLDSVSEDSLVNGEENNVGDCKAFFQNPAKRDTVRSQCTTIWLQVDFRVNRRYLKIKFYRQLKLFEIRRNTFQR